MPAIDPNSTDRAGDEATAIAVATVLAAQPHPARLFHRQLEQYSSAGAVERLLTPQAFYDLVLGRLDPALMADVGDSPWVEIATLLALYGIAGQLDTVDEQIAAWTRRLWS